MLFLTLRASFTHAGFVAATGCNICRTQVPARHEEVATLLMSLELKIVLKSLTLYSCDFKTAIWMRQNLNGFSFKSKLNEI